jgi:4-amino-4-deoxy-L-arabinose transferase-like glycosyltransferase
MENYQQMKRSIFLITLLAFLLRLGLGVTASTLLPQVGYESKPQQAGYLFLDAYRRDNQAWDLAQSSKPLLRAFDDKFSSDQYGGLLWVSAFIYRYLATGVRQPLLIVLLAALVSSLGIPLVYLTAKRLADDNTALLSALIYAFFPEAILLGAAQMREPFLMTFIAMNFYGLTEWQAAHKNTAGAWFWILFSLAGMLFISPGFVVITLVASAGWLYFANPAAATKAERKIPWQVIVGALALFVLALAVVTASWTSLVSTRGAGLFGVIGNWARETARWNAYLLGRSSGIVQLLFQALPSALALPFVAIYGVLQPVLPAVLLEPGIPFWQILGTFRAVGWYSLLPFVAFAPIAFTASLANLNTNQSAKLPSTQPRLPGWLWLSLVVWGWIFIAALRGGGDQWDNPRYRVILLAWMAPLAALALQQLREGPGRWFWRICSVEAIILLVFGHWYSWRYLGFGFNIGIRNTLIIAIVFSLLVVLGDWFFEFKRRKPV